MVQDIAYEQLSIPSVLSSVYLNLISQQVKSKVHFDILHIKPIEFAQHCTVPCVFIIGKQDKLVLPKRVTQIFEAYRGKQKQILSSSGQHSSEREPYIIKQCQDFIVHELRKSSQNHRRSVDHRQTFVNSVSGGALDAMASAFDKKFRENLGRQQSSRNGGYMYGMKYNFDSYLDEARNEERGMEHAATAYFEPEPQVNTNGYRSTRGDWTQAEAHVEITDDEFQAYLSKLNGLIKAEKI